MKSLSKILHVLILLSFFTPYFPIGCKQKESVATEDVIVEDIIDNTDNTLLNSNSDSFEVDSSVVENDTTEEKIPFYAPLIVRDNSVTGFGVLTVDMEDDIPTVLGLRLCYVIAFISLAYLFLKKRNIYKIIFINSIIALLCMTIVFIVNYKDLLYGFYLTALCCFASVLLSGWVWKNEES